MVVIYAMRWPNKLNTSYLQTKELIQYSNKNVLNA